MAIPILAAAAVVSVMTLMYFIVPIVASLQKTRHMGKQLCESFRPMFKDKFNFFWGHIPYHPGPCEEGLKLNVNLMKTEPGVERCYIFYMSSLRPVLVLNHPDTVKPILKTAEPKTTDDLLGYRLLIDWIGDGLLLSKGQKWFRNRRLLTPAFHFDILKPYVKIVNECAEQLMDHFEKSYSDGRSVEIFAPVSLCTLEIMLKCAFSSSEEVQKKKTSPYVNAVINLASLILHRAFRPWLWPDSIYYLTSKGKSFAEYCEISHSKAMSVITERRNILAQAGEDGLLKGRRYVDFLDILLLAKDTDGSPLTDKEIRDEVETFMFEGHDTTKSGICYILYNLARHPEIQQRVRTEVHNLLEGRDSDEILWEDLSKMPYLTQCIKESLRLHPPVLSVGRKVTEPLVVDGCNVPIGTPVQISIWNVHHNPYVWGDDVMEYDPERFSEDNITKMDSHAFIPFSAGPRNCIGQNFAMNEMKVTVARIINRFEMTLDSDVEVEMVPSIVLISKNGINIHFRRL